MDDYYDLGGYSREVQTSSADAQIWFDRGLNWTYGFHHEEAIACFEKALTADPDCAMAHWGVAYAIGPNYNLQWADFSDEERAICMERGRTALAAAEASGAEAQLIDALRARYAEDGIPGVDDFGPFNDSYANAMREVHKANPNDLDIISLFVEALMNRTPWQLWDLKTRQPAEGADTAEAIAALDTAFANLPGARRHPGLLHLHIHLMEMSPTPEAALPSGDALVGLVPASGHLMHMATHIDVLCGDYLNTISRNQAATVADAQYFSREGKEHFYTLYAAHNIHFTIYGAMFLGQKAVALRAADELAGFMSRDVVEMMPEFAEAFVPMKQHVLIRFGDWDAIKAQKLPEEPELYRMSTALTHYAKSVAHSATDEIAEAEAEAEREAFLNAKASMPDEWMLFKNKCNDLLGVAEAMLEGELAYRKADYDGAYDHLRRSVHLSDNLAYDEPWGWMQPARHALGALLMEQGHVDEAEAVYRADLGYDDTLARPHQHPENVWSLHGLHECLVRSGNATEAALIKPRLDIVAARADVPIRASCFCRRS